MTESVARSLQLWVDGKPTGWPVRCAESAWSRARGLLWGRHAKGHAILALRPCAAVHTMGMRRCIDVVFTDRAGRVQRVCPGLRPWRIAVCRGAVTAWEAPSGTATILAIRPGRVLEARES